MLLTAVIASGDPFCFGVGTVLARLVPAADIDCHPAPSAFAMARARLAASATRDLRIRIFAHLQRMSLDYYTNEKGGVILTRMTSDAAR